MDCRTSWIASWDETYACECCSEEEPGLLYHDLDFLRVMGEVNRQLENSFVARSAKYLREGHMGNCVKMYASSSVLSLP
jgi:hypothetical protein